MDISFLWFLFQLPSQATHRLQSNLCYQSALVLPAAAGHFLLLFFFTEFTDCISKHMLSPCNAHYLNYNFFYSV